MYSGMHIFADPRRVCAWLAYAATVALWRFWWSAWCWWQSSPHSLLLGVNQLRGMCGLPTLSTSQPRGERSIDLWSSSGSSGTARDQAPPRTHPVPLQRDGESSRPSCIQCFARGLTIQRRTTWRLVRELWVCATTRVGHGRRLAGSDPRCRDS